MARPTTVPAPLRHAAFRRLGGAYLLNEVGNWLGDVALAVLVFQASGSTLATALLLIGTRGLPALSAPAIAARLSAAPLRTALPGLYLGEALLFGTMALFLPHLGWVPLVLLATADGFLAIGARSLSRAAIATTLSPLGLLREGNALLNVAFAAAAALGPPAAAGLLALSGGRLTLALNALSFLLAGALLVRLAREQVASAADAALHWRERLREGFAYVRRTPRVRFGLAAQGFALLCLSAVGPVEVALATRTLHGGRSGYGLLLTAWGIGMPLGGFLYARFRHGDLVRVAALSTLLVAVSYTITGLAPTLFVACAGAFLGGMGNAIQWVAVLTLLQEATAERRQVAVAGVFEAVASLMPAVGYGIGGAIAALAGPRAGYLAAAAGILVVLAAGRALRPGEAPAEPGPLPVTLAEGGLAGPPSPPPAPTRPDPVRL